MTNSFHDVKLSTRLSYGSRGGPERRTEISTLASGFEKRNTPWEQARRKYNLNAGPRPFSELYELLEFFEARKGRLCGFRWRDWLDHQSASIDTLISPLDQECHPADSDRRVFLLQKQYGTVIHPAVRRIFKPVENTVKVAVDAIELSQQEFTIDHTIGTITCVTKVPDNKTVTAGFEFDVPVRFDTDFLDIQFSDNNAALVQNVPLVEIRM